MKIEKLRTKVYAEMKASAGNGTLEIRTKTVALLLDVAEAMRNFCPDNKALKALDEHLDGG